MGDWSLFATLLGLSLDSGIPRARDRCRAARPPPDQTVVVAVTSVCRLLTTFQAAKEFHQGLPCLSSTPRCDLRDPATTLSSNNCGDVACVSQRRICCGLRELAVFLLFPFSRLLPETRAWLARTAAVTGWTRLLTWRSKGFGNRRTVLCHACAL
jgi:hypothetical protein